MRTLHGAPRLDLRAPEFGFLRRVPADRGWIEKNVCTEQRRDARRLGIPLIPADQHADVGELRLPHTKSTRLLGNFTDAVDTIIGRRITGREVILLVEERIVGN